MKNFLFLSCCIFLFSSAELYAAPWGKIFKGLGKVVKPAKKITPLKVPSKVPKKAPAKSGGNWLDGIDDLLKVAPQSCSHCMGKGSIVCSVCNGSGKVPGILWGQNNCSSCDAKGRRKCTACNGSGKK